MGAVVIDMSMSLDGYIAAPNDTPEQGPGDNGIRLQSRVTDTAGVAHIDYRVVRSAGTAARPAPSSRA